MLLSLLTSTMIIAQNDPSSVERGSLRRRAHEAKKLGKTSINVGFPIVEYGEPEPLDTALEHTTLVLAKPLMSEAGHDDYTIYTWRKYRLLEKISFQRGVYDRPLPRDVPVSMLPIGPDEFVMGEIGGSVVIDGVTVSMQDPESRLLPENDRHLLFVLVVSEGAMAMLNYGPIGAFWVDESDKIHPRVDSDLNELGAELLQRSGGDLSGVRTLCIRCK